jgi:hypothetical protein
VGEHREPQIFNFGENTRGENYIGEVKGQNRATTTKGSSANERRGTRGHDSVNHGAGECKIQDYSQHVVHG